MWDVITHPCPKFDGSLAKLPMKLGTNEYYMPQLYVDVITYPRQNLNAIAADLLVEGAPLWIGF